METQSWFEKGEVSTALVRLHVMDFGEKEWLIGKYWELIIILSFSCFWLTYNGIYCIVIQKQTKKQRNKKQNKKTNNKKQHTHTHTHTKTKQNKNKPKQNYFNNM